MSSGTIEKALISYGDYSIYQSDIKQLCDEYINSLDFPEMVYKTPGFSGLLDYIYKHCLCDIIEYAKKNSGVQNNGHDYKLLDNIFYNIYIPLCYKYGLTPTIQQFSALCKMHNSFLGDVKSGVYSNGAKVNPVNSATVKNWFSTCESALFSRAVDANSIGAIFGLKACYQYSDQQVQQVQITTSQTLETPEQIAERHKSAALPEKPILED